MFNYEPKNQFNFLLNTFMIGLEDFVIFLVSKPLHDFKYCRYPLHYQAQQIGLFIGVF